MTWESQRWWRFRFAILVGVCLIAVVLTRGVWLLWVGQSLVCDEQLVASDAILIDNFDPNYLLFERAEAIKRAGLAKRVLVPGEAGSEPDVPNPVAKGFVDVMARVAWLQDTEFIPVQEREPISLSVAFQVASFLSKEKIRSVILVTPGFRSRRSVLVHQAALGREGIAVRCIPVFSQATTPRTWTHTGHGIQEVALQLLKLQYYRFYVLPFASSRK
jgi:hypothetical protein